MNQADEDSKLYVYVFKDNEDNILYIGKTISLRNRMRQHFTEETIKLEPWKNLVNKENIILLECNNSCDLDIYETYLINKYNPVYNKDKIFNCKLSFDLPYIAPISYNFSFLKKKGSGVFKDKCIMYIEDLDSRDYISKQCPLVKEAYEKLGVKRLKALGYNSSKIKNELHNLDNQNNVEEEIKKIFAPNQFYSSKDVKAKLTNLYESLGLKKKAKSTDIESVFNIKVKDKKINNKTVKGYQL